MVGGERTHERKCEGKVEGERTTEEQQEAAAPLRSGHGRQGFLGYLARGPVRRRGCASGSRAGLLPVAAGSVLPRELRAGPSGLAELDRAATRGAGACEFAPVWAPGTGRRERQEWREWGACALTSRQRTALQALSGGEGAQLLNAALSPHLAAPPSPQPPPAPVTHKAAGARRSGAGGWGARHRTPFRFSHPVSPPQGA